MKTEGSSSRNELLDNLMTKRYAAIYDIFGQVFLHEGIKKYAKGDTELFKNLRTILPEGDLLFTDFLQELGSLDRAAAVETKRNANRFLTRNHFKEVFRTVQSYYSDNKRLGSLKNNSWYSYARILANSLSHNHLLIFTKKDISLLPVEYNGLTIDVSMQGKPPIITLGQLLALTDLIIDFVQNDIS